MANIDTYLQQIMAAIYGEEVRGSIHDAIQEINNVVQNWESGLMDTTLTSTTLPAQGKAVGDKIANIKSELSDAFFKTLIHGSGDKIISGVTFTNSSGAKVKAEGTSTASINYEYFSDTAKFPDGVDKGNTYIFYLKSPLINASFQVFEYVNGAWNFIFQTTNTEKHYISFSSNATGFMARIRIGSGITINEVIDPIFIETGALQEQLEYIDNKTQNAVVKSLVTAPQNIEINGLNFSVLSGAKVKIVGTSTSSTNYEYFMNTAAFPAGIEKSKDYLFWLNEALTNTSIQIFEYVSGSWSLILQITDANKHSISFSDAATGFMMRIRAGAGLTINETVDPVLIETDSLENYLYDLQETGGKTYRVNSSGNAARALLDATAKGNSLVIIDGEHDLKAELESIYGSDYFSNLSASSVQYWGIEVGNGITIKMSSGSKLKFSYTGSNFNVHKYFSPLMLLDSDVRLINVTIESSGSKYCVHDDPLNKINPYHHIYENCNFILDNYEVNTSDHTSATWQTVGGGFGNNGYINIDGGVFESVGAASNARNISFHNCVNANAKSNAFMKNIFCKTGTIVCAYYGNSELISNFVVTGCRVKAAPYKARESSGYDIDNINLLSWNNIVE